MAAKFIVNQDCDQIHEVSADVVLSSMPVMHEGILIGFNLIMSKSIGTFGSIQEVMDCIRKISESNSDVYVVEGYSDYNSTI